MSTLTRESVRQLTRDQINHQLNSCRQDAEATIVYLPGTFDPRTYWNKFAQRAEQLGQLIAELTASGLATQNDDVARSILLRAVQMVALCSAFGKSAVGLKVLEEAAEDLDPTVRNYANRAHNQQVAMHKLLEQVDPTRIDNDLDYALDKAKIIKVIYSLGTAFGKLTAVITAVSAALEAENHAITLVTELNQPAPLKGE